MKYCSKCKQNKDLAEFNKNKTTKDGLQHYCKECKAQYKYPEKLKEYYDTHKVVILAQTKIRQEITNRDQYLAYQKEYHQQNYETNKTEILEYFRQHYKKNKSKIRVRQEKWRKANPKKLVVKEARRRGRKAKADGQFTHDDIILIYQKQNGKCFYCGEVLNSKFDIDHKIPLSRGGSNWPENLCCACARCNRSKHTKTVEEFISITSK